MASSSLVFPCVTYAKQDLPGVLSPSSQKYFNDVIAANKKSWLARPHEHPSISHMVTTVGLQVDNLGNAKYFIFESSGDKKFDEFALQVCKETKIPKPPETWNPDTRMGVIFSSRVRAQHTKEKYRDTNFVETVKTASSVRWAATVLPPEFKTSSLVAIVSAKVSESGKASFELKTTSGNAKYDEFVLDLCRKTFIPTPPTYWDNAETVEVMYASNEAGSSLK